MTAQEECLRRSRESYLELCDTVHKAAITLSEKETVLLCAYQQAQDAKIRFEEAMAKLKAFRGTIQ